MRLRPHLADLLQSKVQAAISPLCELVGLTGIVVVTRWGWTDGVLLTSVRTRGVDQAHDDGEMVNDARHALALFGKKGHS